MTRSGNQAQEMKNENNKFYVLRICGKPDRNLAAWPGGLADGLQKETVLFSIRLERRAADTSLVSRS